MLGRVQNNLTEVRPLFTLSHRLSQKLVVHVAMTIPDVRKKSPLVDTGRSVSG